MRMSWLAALEAMAMFAWGCAPTSSADAVDAGVVGDASTDASVAAVIARTRDATTAQCPFGGWVVESGLDVDGDGALEDVEVQTQTVLCEAMPPAATLVEILDEPAGIHCPIGGTAVETGSDANGNGALEDDELDHIDYICSDVVLGDLSINSMAQLGAFASIRGVTGTLTVQVTSLYNLITLPKLEHVGGSMAVFSAWNVAFPELRDINGGLTMNAAANPQFPKLTRIGSMFLYTASMANLSGFPVLQRIDNSLSIGDTSLTKLELSLDTVRKFNINTCRNLTEIHLHVSHSVDQIEISGNPVLTSLDLQIPGMGDFIVEYNSMLPTCQAQALVDQLHPPTYRIRNNDDTASCAP